MYLNTWYFGCETFAGYLICKHFLPICSLPVVNSVFDTAEVVTEEVQFIDIFLLNKPNLQSL